MRAEVDVMGSGAGTGKIAVQRSELATGEMDVMAALINRQYVEHKAWFRCPARSRVDAGIRSAAAGPLEVSVIRYRGFEYYAQASGPEDYLALVVLSGEGAVIRSRGFEYYAQASGPEDYLALVVLSGEGAFIRDREQLRFVPGDAVLLPSGEPFKADLRDFAYSLVRIPRQFLADVAEERLRPPPGAPPHGPPRP